MLGAQSIRRAFGLDRPRLSILSSAVFVIVSFFYIYTLGSYFRISIYYIRNGVTNPSIFNAYIVNKYLDRLIIILGINLWFLLSIRGKEKYAYAIIYTGLIIIAVILHIEILIDTIVIASVPLAFGLLIYNKLAFKKILVISTSLSIRYFAIIGLVTGIISIILSSAHLFSIPSNFILLQNFTYNIFLFFSSFSTVLILLLICCLPLKIIIDEFITRILKIESRRVYSFLSNENFKQRTRIILISLFMLCSVIIALIPHQPSVNKYDQQIGVDTGRYVRWINTLIQSNSTEEFMHQAFVKINHGDRPFTLISLFMIAKFIKADLLYIFERLPIMLGPSLVLVFYFLTRELTSNDRAALLASFLTAVSFQTTIGIYAGFYANWFALIFGYLSVVFLIRFLKTSTKLDLSIFSISMVLLLFSHVYTWTIFCLVIGIFLLVMFKMTYYRKRNASLLLLVVLSTVVVDVARGTIAGAYSGIESDLGVAERNAGIQQFALRWANLNFAVHRYYNDLFSNSVILLLGLYWLFRSNYHDISNIFPFIFLSIGLIPLIFGNYDLQARILYEIPFQIIAAIALVFIRTQIKDTLIIMSTCIWLLSTSIIIVSNF